MFNTILSWGKCFLDFTLFYWFTAQFFTVKNNKYNNFPIILIIIMSFILYITNLLQSSIINTSVSLICALIINYMLFKGNAKMLFLCSIVEVHLIVICELIFVLSYSLIVGDNVAVTTNETLKNTGFNLISTGLFSVIVIIFRYFMVMKNHQDDAEVSINGNFFIVTVPLVSIIIIYYILYIHYSNTTSNDKNTVLSILIFLGILLMNMVVLIGDSNTRKQYQLQSELNRLHRLGQLNNVIIEQQDQYLEELKGFAHDYVKQLEGIKELITSNDRQHSISNELQRYSSEMLNNIEENYRFAFIPSPALRAILSKTQLHCNTNGIIFNMEIQYADFSFIDFPDLYTIFENPLENAITACNEIKDVNLPKRITLSIFRRKNLIWIKIINTKNNPIIFENNCIRTTKPDSSAHGLGIKNIKRVMKQYNGYIKFSYTLTEFNMIMAIPVPITNATTNITPG